MHFVELRFWRNWTSVKSLERFLYLCYNVRYNYFRSAIAVFVLMAKADIADIRIWRYWTETEQAISKIWTVAEIPPVPVRKPRYDYFRFGGDYLLPV